MMLGVTSLLRRAKIFVGGAADLISYGSCVSCAMEFLAADSH